jgi:uncharacterized protein YraI
MPKLPVNGRIAVLGGVVVTTATALGVAMAAPALAADSKLTSCTDQVRVRSQPSSSAPVIGSCKAGEKITVDETRNGFSHAVNKEGWVSSQYISSGHGRSSHPASSSADDDTATGDDTTGDSTDEDKDKDHKDKADHDGGGLLGL